MMSNSSFSHSLVFLNRKIKSLNNAFIVHNRFQFIKAKLHVQSTTMACWSKLTSWFSVKLPNPSLLSKHSYESFLWVILMSHMSHQKQTRSPGQSAVRLFGTSDHHERQEVRWHENCMHCMIHNSIHLDNTDLLVQYSKQSVSTKQMIWRMNEMFWPSYYILHTGNMMSHESVLHFFVLFIGMLHQRNGSNQFRTRVRS